MVYNVKGKSQWYTTLRENHSGMQCLGKSTVVYNVKGKAQWYTMNVRAKFERSGKQ